MLHATEMCAHTTLALVHKDATAARSSPAQHHRGPSTASWTV